MLLKNIKAYKTEDTKGLFKKSKELKDEKKKIIKKIGRQTKRGDRRKLQKELNNLNKKLEPLQRKKWIIYSRVGSALLAILLGSFSIFYKFLKKPAISKHKPLNSIPITQIDDKITKNHKLMQPSFPEPKYAPEKNNSTKSLIINNNDITTYGSGKYELWFVPMAHGDAKCIKYIPKIISDITTAIKTIKSKNKKPIILFEFVPVITPDIVRDIFEKNLFLSDGNILMKSDSYFIFKDGITKAFNNTEKDVLNYLNNRINYIPDMPNIPLLLKQVLETAKNHGVAVYLEHPPIESIVLNVYLRYSLYPKFKEEFFSGNLDSTLKFSAEYTKFYALAKKQRDAQILERGKNIADQEKVVVIAVLGRGHVLRDTPNAKRLKFLDNNINYRLRKDFIIPFRAAYIIENQSRYPYDKNIFDKDHVKRGMIVREIFRKINLYKLKILLNKYKKFPKLGLEEKRIMFMKWLYHTVDPKHSCKIWQHINMK